MKIINLATPPYYQNNNRLSDSSIKDHIKIRKWAIVQLFLSLFGLVFIIIGACLAAVSLISSTASLIGILLAVFGAIVFVIAFSFQIILICKIDKHEEDHCRDKIYGVGTFICLIIGIFIPIFGWIADCIIISCASRAIG
ncbi:MAG: hypothetical protein HUJ42_01990 [Malacoplasma sp.]|nr:hypothetical protein [Malacoplasma sp.]